MFNWVRTRRFRYTEDDLKESYDEGFAEGTRLGNKSYRSGYDKGLSDGIDAVNAVNDKKAPLTVVVGEKGKRGKFRPKFVDSEGKTRLVFPPNIQFDTKEDAYNDGNNFASSFILLEEDNCRKDPCGNEEESCQ